ncbi:MULTISPECIES: Mu transposase C-terminal domain-containing protein [unclassified Ensifer]|uniref:Mu transposase C-terminal domain-containing protein n=1 Tax=unclassified Ensifer TaxID=2633371 RepID=UPI000812DB62|nr:MULTISPECIES: Mu transposase C-terminal domain-containing protein [unclassified Ensifer]OCP17398.1 hypothetical protein BC361_08035 [Ensifer sp. LC54]OCP28696.1 hypothetical protein BC363_02320 [Ensifer sp. LC384]
MSFIVFLNAQEIADAGKRLKLKAMPHTKQGVIDHITRSGWAGLPDNLRRKREGRGGGWEYHVSLLPDALQAALQAEHSRSVVLVAQQNQQRREVARREALSTSDLTARQRDVMTARSAILSAIETYQISNGLSRRQAIDAFVGNPQALNVMDRMLVAANDRPSQDRDISMRTVQRWFKARDEQGVAALAPLPTKEQQDMPSWFWQFLRFYAQPQKPCLTDALEQFTKALPAHIMPPSYDQVRRLMARLGNVEKHRGREGSLTLKSRQAYVMRSTADLLPTCVYTSDGKTFDAEVAHPIHGQPFKPEITSVVDVATRRCVGFSVGLAENSGGVVDALRHSCERSGIPAIFYVDRGPGFKNEILDDQLTGLVERLGITKLHSLPYNSQARGIIERFNGSVWNPLAQTFDTYAGALMDRQAKQRVFKETRRDMKQLGTSRRLPTFQEFIDACNDAIAAYNARPHASLPGNMSPDQYWEFHVSTGFEIVPVLDSERDDLFRPYVKRRTRRAMVDFLTNSYFHLALEEFDGDDVLVGYDVHDASKVWVREIDRKSGEERMGRLICVAIFAGNEERYIPLTMERAALEKRANARAKRLQDKLSVVEAELSPSRFLEGAAVAPMPVIDIDPEPALVPAGNVTLITEHQSAEQPADPPRKLTFASDEDLAAWALKNPDNLTSNQVRVLRNCLQKPAAIELFRLSGIDVDALRNVIRAAA